MTVTRDGNFIYVRGIVGGYMDSRFERVELIDKKGTAA